MGSRSCDEIGCISTGEFVRPCGIYLVMLDGDEYTQG
jgi:hypothetical protein